MMAPSRGMLLARTRVQLGSRLNCQKNSSARFHTSRRNAFGLTEYSIEAVHTGITFLHSTIGLPWYIALPMTAVALRTTILPLQLIAQRSRQQRASLTPKVLEARPELERKIIAKYNHLGPEKCTRLLSWELAKKREELRREAGISYWAGWAPLAQLPIWLVAIETIRRMSGTRDGLLGIIFGREHADGLKTASTTSGSLVEASTASQPFASHEQVTSLSLNETTNYNPLFEPSLNTGGFLWFPDLLSPDPMLVLPFALSAVMFFNISWEERLVDATGITRPKWSIRLTRGLKLVALLIGPLTLQMPAAMLVYWISSASTALVQKGIVDKIIPIDRQAIANTVNSSQARPDNALFVRGTAKPKPKPYSPIKKPVRRR